MTSLNIVIAQHELCLGKCVLFSKLTIDIARHVNGTDRTYNINGSTTLSFGTRPNITNVRDGDS